MELPSQEGDEMPIPLNSTYGGGHGHGHMIHHHHHHDQHPPPAPPHNHIIIPSSTAAIAVAGGGGGPGPAPQIPSTGPPSAIDVDHLPPFKKIIRYRECLKNHAAAMGGNATDGCGEFMPSGDEGTLEALTCSACSCHRNFHRKETDGDAASCDTCSYHNVVNPRIGRKLFMGHHHHKGYLGAPPDSIGAYHHHAAGALISSRAVQPHQMIMSYNMGGGGGGSLPSESDEQEGNNGGGGLMVRPPHMVKKRFRTKFSQEQKEKMLNFAEKVGWKIQKQEEGVVQQFCQEVGVKRRVLKVWMHNNKHTLAKKTLQSDPQIQSLGTD